MSMYVAIGYWVWIKPNSDPGFHINFCIPSWCQATPPSVSLPQSSWLPPPGGQKPQRCWPLRKETLRFGWSHQIWVGTDQSGINQAMIIYASLYPQTPCVSGFWMTNIEIFTRHLLGFNRARGYPRILRFISCVNAAWWPNPCQERSPLYVFLVPIFTDQLRNSHWWKRMSAFKTLKVKQLRIFYPLAYNQKWLWLSIARFDYQRVGILPWSHPFEPQTPKWLQQKTQY